MSETAMVPTTMVGEYDTPLEMIQAAHGGEFPLYRPASGVMRVVGFSGGIDSQACALWVRERFPREEILLLNTDAGGNEHETTTEFIRWYSEHVFPVVTIPALIRDLGNLGTKPGRSRDRRREFDDDDLLTFERLAYIKGRFPSRKAQFCTQHLKLEPQIRWTKEHVLLHGLDVERYVGVRRDESENRKDTPERAWDELFDCYVNYPMAFWKKAECFRLVVEAGELFNPLYLLGFGRVGCAPCVNSGKEDVANWALRYPQVIERIREWERYVGRTFFPPCLPGRNEINWIDDVVRWSGTARGGRQFHLLPMVDDEEIKTCVSKYGLCE